MYLYQLLTYLLALVFLGVGIYLVTLELPFNLMGAFVIIIAVFIGYAGAKMNQPEISLETMQRRRR